MSDWTKFVTAHYNKMKATNKSYKFKDAMKDAAKLYKKDSSASASVSKKSRKTKKTKKSKTMKKK
jgi:hypothetical protein